MSRKRVSTPTDREPESAGRAGAQREVGAAAESWFSRRAGGVEVRVRVVPRASRQRVVGVLDGRIKVQIHAPPVEGEANRALCALLAEVAGLPTSAVRVVAGMKNRSKTVFLECAELEMVLVRLEAALTEAASPSCGGRSSR